MIKNIVFDLGNVVFKLKWIDKISKFTKIKEEQELLMQVIFGSKDWILLDGGLITREDALKSMLEKLPNHLHEACKILVYNWTDGLVLNNTTVEFIKKIRKSGYKTYILSNTPIETREYLDKIRLSELFDGEILSAEEKQSKPDKEIYETLLQRYNLIPEESLFIDDKEENITAAISLGINGYVFDYNKFDEFLLNINQKYNIVLD